MASMRSGVEYHHWSNLLLAREKSLIRQKGKRIRLCLFSAHLVFGHEANLRIFRTRSERDLVFKMYISQRSAVGA